ncbi:MAG TPA: carboxymuconolactone decarboxylase family protein [Mycobacterium sp.]
MTADALGGRLPLADPTSLTPAQRVVFDRMIARVVPWADAAGFRTMASDGRLIGPFNPALLNPAVTSSLLDLSVAERANTSLTERVREVVILTVGAVWQADYELYAHIALAQHAGLSKDAARMIANGATPAELSAPEAIAQRLTRQLSATHRVDETLYREAESAFGAYGLIDIAFLIGIYHSVCATLTMFAIPAPEQAGQP